MISRRDVLKGAAGVGLWAAGGAHAIARQQSAAPAGEPLVGYVDPFIGTGGDGHTFPGAAMPGGLVQLSPDSGKQGGDWCAGYHYSDTEIAGFSHTHLSGTGIGDLCDILVTPTQAGAEMPGSVVSPFSHEKERASPGYYSVDLLAFDIRAELTATRRVGLHRYSFLRPAASRQPAVSLDLGFAINGDEPVETRITLEGPTTISGYRFSRGWAKDQRVFFVARFSTSFQTWLVGDPEGYSNERRDVQAARARGLFRFVLRPGQPLLLKVGLSPVSVDGARRNLERETPGWEFDGHRKDAATAWERKLQRVRIETPDKARKTVFYTALYHALLAPTAFNDADASYRGSNGQVQPPAAFQNHTVFPLWDTFRALHPLMTLVQAERVDDLVQSMMAVYRESGRLPGLVAVGQRNGHDDRLPRRARHRGRDHEGADDGESRRRPRRHESERVAGRARVVVAEAAGDPRVHSGRQGAPSRSRRRSSTPSTTGASRSWRRGWSGRTTAASSRRAPGSTGTSSTRPRDS